MSKFPFCLWTRREPVTAGQRQQRHRVLLIRWATQPFLGACRVQRGEKALDLESGALGLSPRLIAGLPSPPSKLLRGFQFPHDQAEPSWTSGASQEPLHWMEKLETMTKGYNVTSLAGFIRSLEHSLLNTSFGGKNLTLQTHSIQTLAFKLGCDFTGLTLNSAALEPVPQAQVPHAMQFPAELTQDACRARRHGELRLICIYFFTDYFFQPALLLSFQNNNSSLLNNYVLGAQLGQRHVKNLREPVNISFWHNRSLEGYTVTCVFWKEEASKDHWGVWSPEGCRTEQPSPSQVLCRCNHLTYFAVLMQLSSAPVPANLLAPLTYISLVGCSVSIVASLLTILLHFQARKQGDSITHIHTNLHASVLLLNVAFLLSPVLPGPGPACTALGAVLHFALLSCLTWMAIEGFNLYLLLVRVYNIYIRRYMLKLCVVGWGVPALLVLLLLVVRSSVYGVHTIPVFDSQGNGTGFQNNSICWVRSPWVHNILVMGYGGLTSLFNLVVLAWALRAVRRLRAQEKVPGPRACRDSVTVLGLTMLLGTTWALAFFSFGVFLLPQLFLFTIFNSLFLPLPVVLLPEVPLGGSGGGRDGGVQLLPDDAVVWASWPRAQPLCLQPETLASTREGGRLCPPGVGGLSYLHGFPRSTGQHVALPPSAFCSGAGSTPLGVSKLYWAGHWPGGSGGHVSRLHSESRCMPLGLWSPWPWSPHL
ncbi:adhesion G-protein coupled receptor G5 isoform X3 [Hyaena hyaena]|uniref:adhesion G-protein coupled receptor G5 isoform X3 n=1 Tax=Hyaena hyaena TaxID=95912 RepID=UPI00192248CE|nr:adhesion G-protein coupled receptor G5 isoform X3 [Hyaena hyaena]